MKLNKNSFCYYLLIIAFVLSPCLLFAQKHIINRPSKTVRKTITAKRSSNKSSIAWSTTSISEKEIVDLGLSVYWRGYNLGASSPEEKGLAGNKWRYAHKDVVPDYLNGWRTPTVAEMKELISECVWKKVSYKGIRGYKVTGRKGNSIFLPVTEVFEGEYYGRYWSFDTEMMNKEQEYRFPYSYRLIFGMYNNIDVTNLGTEPPYIRPVKDKK